MTFAKNNLVERRFLITFATTIIKKKENMSKTISTEGSAASQQKKNREQLDHEMKSLGSIFINIASSMVAAILTALFMDSDEDQKQRGMFFLAIAAALIMAVGLQLHFKGIIFGEKISRTFSNILLGLIIGVIFTYIILMIIMPSKYPEFF